ncbi:alpha/beta hydrolase [Sphingomonas naphthae]|uniref:Alpha/beta hydrolase n=1 Tax=Sphingomonas naphthae TaxID=1813468 RepID=A0ABY7TFK2_9SPHN|nr:alpha/beta hydrolase [Sphingomonas naphthae]WCT72016.1 alpha/beta hydrolase [Sphingomonas naphthae]
MRPLQWFAALFALVFLAGHALAAPTRFTVEVSGKGPDVILIPGLASSADVLRPTAKRLAANHRVHLIQVAGFAGAPVAGNGGEGPVVAPLAEEIAAYITASKLTAPAVIGHSMGAETGLMLAERHPALVGRLLAVDALPFFPLVMNPAATVETVAPQAALFRDRMAAATPGQWAAMQTAGMARYIKTEAARPGPIREAVASDKSVVARAAYELMTTDLRPDLARVTVPVTVLYAYDPVYGVGAEVIDALYAGAYAGTAKLTLKRIDGSFHFIMLDQPAAFDAAVDAFLK